ncbi:hypothetical protein G7046_g6000 [Stylonectria norvegica]|nr:hypothetical protein G7046_g6000 [Stylonectria norvegica]
MPNNFDAELGPPPQAESPQHESQTVFQSVDFDAGKNHWLHGKLWMGDHPFEGQLAVARLDPETDTTRLYQLKSTEEQSSGDGNASQISDGKWLFPCKSTVNISEADIFHVNNRSRPGTDPGSVCPSPPDEPFSPATLLANYSDNKNPILRNGYGKDRFQLPDHNYVSVDPLLFTPDTKHAYRGIWVADYPGHGYEFLLFHQENEKSLEVIKLTGDRNVPRGAHSIIVEDLSHTTRLYSDAEWPDAFVVAAKMQAAEDEYVDSAWYDAELVLVSHDEVIVVIEGMALQLKRVCIETVLSDGKLAVPDCCVCDELAIDQNSLASTVKVADGPPQDDIISSYGRLTIAPDSGPSIVEDAMLLGLGKHRTPLNVVFQSPLEDDVAQRSLDARDDCSLHKFCRCCTKFFASVALVRDPSQELLPPQSQHRLHGSLSMLKRAVRDGCHFCSLALYNLNRLGMITTREEGVPADGGVYIFYSFFQGKGRERVTWDYEKDLPPPPFESPTIYVSLHPTGRPLETFIKPGKDVKDYIKFIPGASNDDENHPSSVPHISATRFTTQSPEHMELAQDWVEQCTENHAGCNIADATFTPTRLLYVGDTSLRLHLTKGEEDSKTYCVLSHCWGGVTDIPLLKKNTVAQFVRGIDINTLPRSFQDAVLITRQLDIDYLWIDSLCIIQDCKDDWAAEAAVMGKVYENGYCTIALAEAKTPHEGAFVRRDPQTCTPVRIARLPHAELLLQPPMPNRESSSDIRMSAFVVWSAKLLSRGWVFQEALLSRRILYFGRGLFWTCRRGQASELDPTGRGTTSQGVVCGAVGEAIFPPSQKRSKGGDSRRKKIRGGGRQTKPPSTQSEILDMFFRGQPSGGNSPGRAEYEALLSIAASSHTADHSLHIQWFRLLKTYTSLQLTMAKDRLAALAGIAQNIQRPHNWRYLAGLWEPSLPFDLVWTTWSGTEDKELAPRPAEARAPTWSWASVDADVWSNLNTLSAEARKETQFLAQVTSAVTECHPADVHQTGEVYSGELVIEGMLVAVTCAAVEDIFGYLSLTDAEGSELGELTPDIKPVGVEGKLMYVLPVLRAPVEYGAHAGEMTVHGIGLVDKGGYFERVGCCSYTCLPPLTLTVNSSGSFSTSPSKPSEPRLRPSTSSNQPEYFIPQSAYSFPNPPFFHPKLQCIFASDYSEAAPSLRRRGRPSGRPNGPATIRDINLHDVITLTESQTSATIHSPSLRVPSPKCIPSSSISQILHHEFGGQSHITNSLMPSRIISASALASSGIHLSRLAARQTRCAVLSELQSFRLWNPKVGVTRHNLHTRTPRLNHRK